MKLYTIALALSLLAFGSSCSTTQEPTKTGFKPRKDLEPDGRLAGTWQGFVADPNYRTTRDVWYHDGRIASANKQNTRTVILTDEQRGRLFVNNEIAMDFPVCTGTQGHRTPKGTYSISQKEEFHRSTLYGNKVDGKFVGTAMPYWMRFNGAVGMHVGPVFRDEDSHGCVRIPPEPCKILFHKLGTGSKVTVQ